MSFEIAHEGNISTTVRRQSQDPVETRTTFVRTTGLDINDGLTPATAVRTLDEAANRIRNGPRGRYHQVMDLSGFVDTITAVHIQTPEGGYESFEFGRPGAFDDGKLDIFTSAFEMRADPLLVQGITITNEAVDPTSGHIVFTVSETLVPDAHVGQWVDGGILVVGVIHSNTANTITVATDASGFATSANIYTQSCVLSSDDFALLNLNCGGSVTMVGIKVVNTNQGFDQTSFKYTLHSQLVMYMCHFDGVTSIREDAKAGIAEYWYCYIYTRFWPEQHAHSCTSCVFEACNFSFHGSGGAGLNALASCILSACDAYAGNNLENAVDLEINSCYFLNATGHAIHMRSPYHGLVRDCRIDDSGGDAIHVSCGGGYKHIEGTTGTGNAGYGLALKAGAQAHSNGSGNTVSGALGEVKVGDAAVSSWSDGESNDSGAANPEMCRIFKTL